MPKSGDDVSRLFKSLGIDDTQFKVANKTAAHEAEQRWPLFKAVLPKKPVAAPALSQEERQFWSIQERSEAGNLRKPALSLPGLTDKLADSLSKMGSKRAAKVVTPALQRKIIKPSIPPVAATRVVSEATDESPPARRRSLFPKSVATELPKVDVKAEAIISPPLFARQTAVPVVAAREAAGTAHADQSLSGIFSRLDQKEEPVRKTMDNRPAFLGRLGKR